MEDFQECLSPCSSLSLSSTSSSSSPVLLPSSPSSSSSSSSSYSPHPLPIDDELWLLAEKRVQEILCVIQPALVSEENRKSVVSYIHSLIRGYYDSEVFPFGSVPLKTFLPDGDIDLTALSHPNMEENLANYICSILQDNQRNSEFVVEVFYRFIRCISNGIFRKLGYSLKGF
ncbi:hypothetical protein V6N13_032913 [Hibiscus sabdariffa]